MVLNCRGHLDVCIFGWCHDVQWEEVSFYLIGASENFWFSSMPQASHAIVCHMFLSVCVLGSGGEREREKERVNILGPVFL